MKTFAVSFKGGTARGFASIGAVRFFQEEGLKPTIYAGSSAGAIIAAAFGLGYTWEELIELTANIKLRKIVSIKSLLKRGSVVGYENFKKGLLSNAKGFDEHTKIEDLPFKLVIFATDPISRKRVYVTKGNLVNALIASSSYPVIFPNVKVNNKILIDGDLTSSFSNAKLKEMGVEKVIGITSKIDRPKISTFTHSIINKIFTLINIMQQQISDYNQEVDAPDLTIEYSVKGQRYFGFSDIKKYSVHAYREIRKHRGEILRLLK